MRSPSRMTRAASIPLEAPARRHLSLEPGPPALHPSLATKPVRPSCLRLSAPVRPGCPPPNPSPNTRSLPGYHTESCSQPAARHIPDEMTPRDAARSAADGRFMRARPCRTCRNTTDNTLMSQLSSQLKLNSALMMFLYTPLKTLVVVQA